MGRERQCWKAKSRMEVRPAGKETEAQEVAYQKALSPMEVRATESRVSQPQKAP